MATIAQNLARLQTARISIADAITAKGGTVNNGDGFEQFPADIATIPSGGGSGDASKPVRFIDYDGSIVASYTPEEFAELTEMPANPSHDGLTAQGWNWSLADAKEYVSSYGTLNVGQMYITDDGRTRLYVRIQDGRRSPILKLYLNDNTELDIDWGDDTPHSTFTTTSADYKSEQHTYASAGDYIISIGVTNGSFPFQSSSTVYSYSTLLTNSNTNPSTTIKAYLGTIRKIEIGDGVTSIGEYAFDSCSLLSQVSIPSSVTSIGGNAFSCCYSLSQVAIPSSVTSIGKHVFRYCYSLSQVAIPDGVTSIGDNAFNYCSALGYIKFTRNSPPAVSSSYTWYNVPTDCKILVPRGTLSAYESATNYPSSSTYTYEEYDV